MWKVACLIRYSQYVLETWLLKAWIWPIWLFLWEKKSEIDFFKETAAVKKKSKTCNSYYGPWVCDSIAAFIVIGPFSSSDRLFNFKTLKLQIATVEALWYSTCHTVCWEVGKHSEESISEWLSIANIDTSSTNNSLSPCILQFDRRLAVDFCDCLDC